MGQALPSAGDHTELVWRLGPVVLLDRGGVVRLLLLVAALAIGVAILGAVCLPMPGQSYHGPLPPLTPDEQDLATALRRDVEKLAGEYAERNVYDPATYAAAADYVETRFGEAGYEVTRQTYRALVTPCDNLIATLPGGDLASEIVVIGAHYDAVGGCSAANDNATGVAGLLALAAAFAGQRLPRTVRFVAFANEEPPFFQTAEMGSWVYAKACRRRGDSIVAMLSLETIGYYSNEAGSQAYPSPFEVFYPDTGDFIAFVGDAGSRGLVRRAIGTFRERAQFPSEGIAAPAALPGIGWSDHWAFRREAYPAVMVTDTALFRYPYYHTPQDTPDKLDFERCARVVAGLVEVVRDLAGGRSPRRVR